MNIYIIRHGESDSDIKQKYDGDYDDNLTQAGIDQAYQVAENSILESIEIIYTSPKIRAKETAQIINKKYSVNLNILEELAEQDIYGAFLDLGKDQPEEEYRRLGEILVNKETAYDGAETYWDFRDRVLSAFNFIQSLPYQHIAIITHGGPIRCIFRELIKTHNIESLGNGAIIELNIVNNQIQLGKTSNVVIL